MKRFFNPLLPNYEYIPDPEPRLFNGRIYIYGSHDKFNGYTFCLNDYVTYSCSVDDLTNRRYEGVIYKKSQDKMYKGNLINVFFASDCIQGLDGRYYLYYTLGFKGYIAVAVSNSPAGPFEFYGYVKDQDGTLLGSKKGPLQFDPGIFIDDDKKIYLYSGYAPKRFGTFFERRRKPAKEGAMVYQLDKDMLTVISEVKYIAKTIHNSKGTSFYGHEFFEASSMRKFNDTYYFIYSSFNGHELCYATSKYPDRDFEYQGVLISNCDKGISKFDTLYPGNNHGSILKLKDKYYIFYHRQTNRNSFSRQTMVEEIDFKDGKFKQAEMTSMGILHKPLEANGEYSSSIACNLFSKKGTYFCRVLKNMNRDLPYFTQELADNDIKETQYVANFQDGSYLGFKYFNFDGPVRIGIQIKGKGLEGHMVIFLKDIDHPIDEFEIKYSSNEYKYFYSKTLDIKGIHALYFGFFGYGEFDIKSIIFEK